MISSPNPTKTNVNIRSWAGCILQSLKSDWLWEWPVFSHPGPLKWTISIMWWVVDKVVVYLEASYISYVITSCFNEASVFNWLNNILLPFFAIHFLEIVSIIENYTWHDMITTLNFPLSFHRKKIKQLLLFTIRVVNNRYVYFYSSLVKGIIVTVTINKINKYFDSQGKHRKEVIFRQVYCPPSFWWVWLREQLTLWTSIFVLWSSCTFTILCFRCSGHKAHTILSPQMICVLNQVCVDGYEEKTV